MNRSEARIVPVMEVFSRNINLDPKHILSTWPQMQCYVPYTEPKRKCPYNVLGEVQLRLYSSDPQNLRRILQNSFLRDLVEGCYESAKTKKANPILKDFFDAANHSSAHSNNANWTREGLCGIIMNVQNVTLEKNEEHLKLVESIMLLTYGHHHPQRPEYAQ